MKISSSNRTLRMPAAHQTDEDLKRIDDAIVAREQAEAAATQQAPAPATPSASAEPAPAWLDQLRKKLTGGGL